MIEMAQAYATIQSGGYAVKTFGVKRIKDRNDKVVYEYKPEAAPRVFRGSDVGALTDMMASVVQNGTGGAAASGFLRRWKNRHQPRSPRCVVRWLQQ